MQSRRWIHLSYRAINIAVYSLGYAFFRVSFLILFRMRVQGSHQVPKSGAFILASNHSSFLDPPIAGVSCGRELHYLARSSLMRNPLARSLFRLWNCTPIDRDKPSPAQLRRIVNLLREGKPLLVFPEGTRSGDGQLQQPKVGLGFIAHKAQVPVIPVYIEGTHKILPKGAWMVRPRKLVVKIGRPVDLAGLYEKKGSNAVYQEISDTVMDAIKHLL